MEVSPHGVQGIASHTYGDTHFYGNAPVHLGDQYIIHRDLFEAGTEEQRRAGKPASGKSILMRYLSHSSWTREQLHKTESNWKILHFFYDYNFGDELANRPLGMLKSFVRQLCESFPSISKVLDDPSNRARVASTNLEDYMDLIGNVLRTGTTGTQICAFIDGLDEYAGDLNELCDTLEHLRDRTNMKTCVASRPEVDLVHAFKHMPTISMQYYNSASNRSYIDKKVSQASARDKRVTHVFTAQIRDLVVAKSQGVILWAKFVTDEMLQTIDQSTRSDDLSLLLEKIPPALQDIYQRILDKMPPHCTSDVALLLKFVLENNGDGKPPATKLLFEAMKFVTKLEGRATILGGQVDEDIFEARVKILLGNLLDNVSEEALLWYPGYMNAKSLKKLRVMVLLLLHATLATYLRTSSWLGEHLAASERTIYASCAWYEVYMQTIVQLENDNEIQQLRETDDFVVSEEHVQCSNHSLPNLFARDDVPDLSVLCRCAIANVPVLVEKNPQLMESSLVSVSSILRSRTTAYHLALCEKCSTCAKGCKFAGSRASRFQALDALDLMVAAWHALEPYIQHRLETTREMIAEIPKLVFYLTLTSKNDNEMTMPLIDLLLSKGQYVDSDFLCQDIFMSGSPEVAAKIQYALSHRLSRPWSGLHDVDCSYFGSNAILLNHYELPTSNRLGRYQKTLNIFLAAHENIDGLREEGESGKLTLLRSLLHDAYYVSMSSSRPLLMVAVFRERFRVLQDAGASPLITGPKGDIMSTARGFGLKYRVRRTWKKPFRPTGQLVQPAFTAFFDDVIADTEYYEKHNRWPRPELTYDEYLIFLRETYPDPSEIMY